MAQDPHGSPAGITYNLNNVCNAGASPIPSPAGSAPRFSGERTNNQLQGHYTTIYSGCQSLFRCILHIIVFLALNS